MTALRQTSIKHDVLLDAVPPQGAGSGMCAPLRAESGMGYQRVRVRLKAGRTVDEALVYNASVLEIPDGVAPFGPQDIAEIELAVSQGR